MNRESQKEISWGFYSFAVIALFLVLQILRWRIFPQFLDMYYHLSAAWGFVKAGGYTGWDFWQYAPVGRVNIYPPVFHMILAFFLKLGVNNLILAKLFETIFPVLFLVSLWCFAARNYGARLAFFCLVCASSSFSFYLSLINYIPATLALILGFCCYDQLLRGKALRAGLFLALCFYTHIGVSWFLTLSVIIFAAFENSHRKAVKFLVTFALILSGPMLIKQLTGLGYISLLDIKEKFFCEFKIVDYLLAIFSLVFIIKNRREYRLFLSLFLASLIFLAYPYRFFSAQGYLPIIFFVAVFLDFLYKKFIDSRLFLKCLPFTASAFILLVSPTLLIEDPYFKGRVSYKIYSRDSALMNMLLPGSNARITSNTLWFPAQYLPAVKLIGENSRDSEIIYSDLNNIGVSLSSISGRGTANALFREMRTKMPFDPISSSRIIALSLVNDLKIIDSIVSRYGLIKLAENDIFILYKNPRPEARVVFNKASFSFILVYCAIAVFLLFFFSDKGFIPGFKAGKNKS